MDNKIVKMTLMICICIAVVAGMAIRISLATDTLPVAELKGFQIEVFTDQIENPLGMHFDSSGDLLVVSMLNGAIKKIKIMDGENKGIVDFANGLPERIEYIDQDITGAVYSATSNCLSDDCYVIKILPDGKGWEKFIPEMLEDSRGIAFDANGHLFVANNVPNGYASRFDRKGKWLGDPVPAHNPLDLGFSPNGDLFIADNDFVSLVSFDKFGQVLNINYKFSELPTDNPLQSGAMGIGFDNDGNLFVGQWNLSHSGKIFLVDRKGKPSLFARGFSQPRDIVFDAENRMYVSDMGHDRIYRISNSPPKVVSIDKPGAGS